ncbi:hypothetical protein ACFFSH_22720 [Streptomyces filamentosus]|uniref:Uncharacterized protein n=1 Tax=Streptomyces filamentosus TaxID=67294 RepID=A0A919BE75_STRFL|nr:MULTISPECIES: hypothetical protein [Streptomyces]KAA6219980.1 hypothetical protein CP979_26090 [Streptomyces filamentosus]GHF82713.1 hypothetical protein GCM10017667_08320 [Streptomyces filamentosus]
MFRRAEAVPFAFVAEADEFRSNVTPPPRERLRPGQVVGRTLLGLTVVAGLVGSLVLGMPSLDSTNSPTHQQQSEASDNR